MSMAVEEFVNRTLKLLEKERQAEIDETRALQENVPPKELQKRGVCLLRMRVGSQYSGMYGRTVLVFEPYHAAKEMPSHNFTPGDIAGVSLNQSDSPAEILSSGIVSKVTSNAVHVAFDESLEKMDMDEEQQYKLAKLANDVTYRRLKSGLQELNAYRSGPSGNMINMMFGLSAPSLSTDFISNLPEKDLNFFNENLDDSQKEAVRFALSQKETAIIHGPPGTGKTTTVIEILLQAVRFNQKILVCAPSNIAVDNLVERLAGKGPKIVRLGHPARVLPHIQKYSLDAILASSDETQLVKDVRTDMDKALSKLRKTRDKGKRQQVKDEMKFLRKELREREEKAVRELLKRADIVLSTLTSAGKDGPMRHLTDDHFDLVVIDECSQSLEAGCWIALLQGPRCILAGDHHQLPPTIISHQAAKEGLAVTLMERLLPLYKDSLVRMLTTQYRMNEQIMQWASDQLYEGKLNAHHTVAKHLLQDLENVEESEDTNTALVLIDTAGCDILELDVPDEMSKGNEGEADLVAFHVEELIKKGVEPPDIAVITPYNLQVDLLRLRLSSQYPKLEIKSVDGFQGREKEAVVISLVRSNPKGEVGFLAEDRRINVAITRARRHLAVICDTETVSHHKFLKSLIDYMSVHGDIRSAQQYIHDGVELRQLADVEKLTKGARPKVLSKSSRTHEKKNKQSNISQNKTDLSQKTFSQKSTSKPIEIGLDLDLVWDTEKIITELTSFIADPEKREHQFPNSLSSKERFNVHEVAEKMGLSHVSVGEGTERHITVSKEKSLNKPDKHGSAARILTISSNDAQKGNTATSSGSFEKVECTEKEIQKNSGKTLTDRVKKNKANKNDIVNKSLMESQNNHYSEFDHKECSNCHRQVPLSNYDLHILRCKPVKVEKVTMQEKLKSAKSKSKAKKKHVNGATVKSDLVKVDKDDFDALVATAVKENSSCRFKKCKSNAATLGQNCQFCSQRFCIEHFIPEVHGCGDAAKTHARKVIVKEGVLYRGSGVPDKKPDPDKRAQLQRKMDKKKQELNKQRHRKEKD